MSLKIPVVVVDEAIRTVLQSRLRNWEYDVSLACDGAEAGKLAQSYDPDVISDVLMPDISGRRDDLPLLIRHFLTEFDRQYRVRTPGVREDAMAQICCHSWPGNVRELRNALERAVILAQGGWIERAHLPQDVLRCSPVPANGIP